jgi:hypothetical protein
VRGRGFIAALRALLFAILWTILIAPLTILLVCVVGLLAGEPEARPPSRIQILPGRLRRFRHYRRL